MFVCNECEKQYASRYALNRHAQNHARAQQHTCSVCNVSYSRRDLLSRHQRIHQRAASTHAAAEHGMRSPSTPLRLPRQRRHTACIRCSELRKKCIGGDPCGLCAQSGYACAFPSDRGRISHIRSHSSSGISVSDGKDDEQLEMMSSEQHTDASRDLNTDASGADSAHDGNAVFQSSPGASRVAAGTSPGPAELMVHPSANEEDLLHLPETTTAFSPDLYAFDSWAWTHENLYLQAQDQSWPDFRYFAGLQDSGTSADDPSAILGPSNAFRFPSRTATPHHSHRILNHAPSTFETLAKDPVDGSEQAILLQQQRLTDELVSYAALLNMSEARTSDHAEYWSSTSEQVCNIFRIDNSQPQTTMQRFMDLYLQHFWPLWPVLAKQTLDINHLHPLLYLVLASIGAMYGGPASVCFGRMMHNKVRAYLTVAFELDDNDGDFFWLAQARLYTQIAALYFGQRKAFTYAQHIGALLIAQGRKIELFSADQAERAHEKFISLQGAGRDAERLAIWLRLEARRRLAFGIFRVDTYTSVLLGTRPLLSLDEIDLSFPHCDAIWRAPAMPVDACLHMIDHDRTPSRKLRASDIYRIALDPDEELPTLDPVAHELLLFGLQRPLGRFAYGHSPLERLPATTQSEENRQSEGMRSSSRIEPTQLSFVVPHTGASGTGSLELGFSEPGSLAVPVRKMLLLLREYENVLQSQRKWEEALSIVRTFITGGSDRSSLMSGLVLFHLGYLRLHAPISKLHQVQYKMVEGRLIEPTLIESTQAWATSPVAKLAAQRSCDLYSLVAREAFSPGPDRVKFNLLAFIGLHHAAVILWSYVGNYRGQVAQGTQRSPSMHIILADQTCVSLEKANSGVIMQAFIDLFHQVSPGSWSSFAESATSLALKPFPSYRNNDPSASG